VIVIDDIYPNHPLQAARIRKTQAWTGDVWKIVGALKKWRPDLKMLELDTHPTGLLLVSGLDPGNRAIDENMMAISRDLGPEREPPDRVLRRLDALTPNRNALMDFVGSSAKPEPLHIRLWRRLKGAV
jgi:hypothetical protein